MGEGQTLAGGGGQWCGDRMSEMQARVELGLSLSQAAKQVKSVAGVSLSTALVTYSEVYVMPL